MMAYVAWVLLWATVVGAAAIVLSIIDRRMYVKSLHAMRAMHMDSFGVIGGPQFTRCKACGKVHSYYGQPVQCSCGAMC